VVFADLAVLSVAGTLALIAPSLLNAAGTGFFAAIGVLAARLIGLVSLRGAGVV